MNPVTVTLRREEPADYHEVESLIREAFWNHFMPGCSEHYLAHILRESPAFVPKLDILAEADGKIVGHIMYSRGCILLDAGGELPVLSFGPIAVLPSCQGQGVGKRLIEHTLALAREAGESAVLIYGDPAYYSRFGFKPAEIYDIGTADNRYLPSLQAYELQPGALQNAQGRFSEASAFDMEPAAVEAFDTQFSPREKLSGMPSQQLFLTLISQGRPRNA